MGGEEESLLLTLRNNQKSKSKRGNVDICGSRDISDLAQLAFFEISLSTVTIDVKHVFGEVKKCFKYSHCFLD